MTKEPYELVADALGCDKASLSDDSALNRHPQWDSIGHLNVMMALEEHYGVDINDESIAAHQNMDGVKRSYDAWRVKSST